MHYLTGTSNNYNEIHNMLYFYRCICRWILDIQKNHKWFCRLFLNMEICKLLFQQIDIIDNILFFAQIIRIYLVSLPASTKVTVFCIQLRKLPIIRENQRVKHLKEEWLCLRIGQKNNYIASFLFHSYRLIFQTSLMLIEILTLYT